MLDPFPEVIRERGLNVLATDDAVEIESLVRRHGENLMAGNVAAQLALWDSQYANLTLLPSERSEPLRGWSEIENYYETMMPHFATKRWDISSFRLDHLSKDVAFAFVLVEAEASESLEDLYPNSGDESRIWLGRISYVLRRTESGWKIIHSEDSTHDLFRAYQLWDRQKRVASKAVDLLKSLLSTEDASA